MAKGNLNFEIPAEMRALAEKSVEQPRQAFETFMSAATEAATTADRRASGARAGARGVGELAVRFAERNIASSFEFAERLVRSNDHKGGQTGRIHSPALTSRRFPAASRPRRGTMTFLCNAYICCNAQKGVL